MSNYKYRKFKDKMGWALKTNPFTRRLIINYINKKNSINFDKMLDYIDTANKVIVSSCKLRLGIVKDEDKTSFSLNTYWPKFERFAKYNNIHYSFLNIHSDNWIKESANYDLIVWRPLSDPASLYEASIKMAYIEKFLKIRCHPSSNELWFYEDKIRQYYHLSACNLPVIPTFISFDEQECINKLETFEYPLVSKSYIGSSSLSVSRINNKAEAKRHIFKAFSKGLNTGFPYLRQKGYVFFQKYIDDATYDLRIIMVGEKIFGYYRMKPNDDFRASGAGLIVKDELPLDAVLLAMKVKEKMPSTMRAVDMLKSKKDDKYYIIETSISLDISTPEQLVLKNVPGYYILTDGSLDFHPGKFWLQELILEELIKESASMPL
jgi:glutathione synthase/RimK-type ligase-like ATP-grasp enzyme